ncbi:MAG: DegT/DnrJ/EryC1/StrS family aminotransferase [Synergistaceae bacterium]|nr:DegT/DnrJ/EryC1/StrS family aminotransferase [Synergistaceae bacterium]
MKVYDRLDRQYEKFAEEYKHAALRVLDSGWYILGNELEEFEKEFACYTGSPYCVGLNSGLDALILAVRALNIGPGDEVIVPANTYIATVLGITANGAVPVFCEPDEFYNLDASRIESLSTDRTRALMAVHLYGQAANMTAIKSLADSHGLYLIEDCAQSHSAKFDGITTGTWGDVGCFSFYPTKNLGAFGDAGAVLVKDKELAEKFRALRNYGSQVKYHNDYCGINSRLDEMQAALLRVKLSHLDELIHERGRLKDKYLSGIKNPAIILPKVREKSGHVWHLFVIRCERRDELHDYLESKGIHTQIHYPIPPHMQKCYDYLGHHKGDFPIAEKFADEVLSLPFYNGMTDNEIDYVIEVINAF